MIFSQDKLRKIQQKHPILQSIMKKEPVLWKNPYKKNVEALESSLTMDHIHEAEKLWERFAPFLMKEFPETREAEGVIESPLREIPEMKNALENNYAAKLDGRLFLKCDNELSIAGSIKARGGFYEVLYYAEKLALDAGLITKEDNYEAFSSHDFKNFFAQYKIGVGSTGNLGLSIGIMSAKLGFTVSVYMSHDAKQWKKDLLREKGANVYEFEGDFGKAIKAGREETLADPKGYFVDDESSQHLFLGYSTAALRLKKQFEQEGIKVDAEHPLFVYLPCGVGGAPGGITFGMKLIFGDHVHAFFVEPVQSPSVLTGLVTGEKDKISVQDIGLDNKTEADGLAVGRPSTFASSTSEQLISGIYTFEDTILFQLLAMIADTENIYLEPSATAGLTGPIEIFNSDYLEKHQINSENATYIAWATGGGLVPEEEIEDFYQKGKSM
ncbi:D-serine ammonia-lyase [Virgibacillus oceani]